MPTAAATLHPTAQIGPSTQVPVMAVGEVLARVSALVAELGPRDGAWHSAGRHLTAVVAAVRHALDGSGSPIAVGEEVSPVLRLRDLACTVQRAVGAPGTVVPTEEVAGHLAALGEAVIG